MKYVMFIATSAAVMAGMYLYRPIILKAPDILPPWSGFSGVYYRGLDNNTGTVHDNYFSGNTIPGIPCIALIGAGDVVYCKSNMKEKL